MHPRPDQTDQPRQLRERDLRGLVWRNIGPANMGGRLAAIALAPSDSKTIYLGYATGGVWKSTDNGVTFTPIFDDYETASIGALAVADAPPTWKGWSREDLDSVETSQDLADKGRGRIVWVGTGEGNGRNSSSWGNGVYRSTDGGKTFEHLGLAQTHDITRIALDPRDPDVAYVAAMGHLWGPNEERGLYKTSDGGKTWKKSLYIDENTGCVDVVVDPQDPDIVYAAMYARRRTPWSFSGVSETGGVFRSTDGGATWTKLTKGLPRRTGRIGLTIAPSNPDVVMAVIESDEGGHIGAPFPDRSRAGGVFRSEDGGDTWERVSDFVSRPFYFSTIRIDPRDDEHVLVAGFEIFESRDGGRTFRKGVARTPHVDYHAMVIDPHDPDHILVGTDGGLYVSWNGGKTWDFHNHMAVGQFYNVSVDDSEPYRVLGGLQDNGSWIGPSASVFEDDGAFMGKAGALTNADWRMVFFGDGFHTAFDPEDPNIVYAESQGGNFARIHLDTGETYDISPRPREGQSRFRFNWNSPLIHSLHEPDVLYVAGNFVFKLTDKGDRWERISPDLTRHEADKITTVGSDAETYGTVVSLAQSPLDKDLLWAGSDDGLVHVTTDEGGSWRNVTPEAAQGLYIAEIEPSNHDRDTAYVAVDGHRSDDFTVRLLMTTDLGRTWTDIAGDLPQGFPVRVVREDPHNPDLLYAGTERGVYVTIDRGAHWVRLTADTLPTVRVDDLKIQRRERDLVAATHGRSIWILDDVSPLAQLTEEVVRSPFHLFEILPARPRYTIMQGGVWSDRMFTAPNNPLGAAITYWIRDVNDEDVSIEILDRFGQTIRTLTGSNRSGLNRVWWDLQADPRQRLASPHPMPQFVPAGTYTVRVRFGDRVEERTVEVLPAPRYGDNEGKAQQNRRRR